MSEDPELRFVLNYRRRRNVAAKYALRHAFAFAVAVVIFVVLFLKTQGHPAGSDQALDLFAAATVAAGAGACFAGIRLSVKSLRRAAGAPPTTHPKSLTIGRGIRLFNWALLILAATGFIPLVLLALSIGCHRPDWVAWLR